MLAARQVLHRDNGEEPQTLDPHLAEGVPAANILRDLFEGLTAKRRMGVSCPAWPCAGTSAATAASTPFTCAAMRTGRMATPCGPRILSTPCAAVRIPRTASKVRPVLLPIENAAAVLAGQTPPEALGVEALDEYTLQIRLVGPDALFSRPA